MQRPIIQHFKQSEAMPNGLEKERGIAMSGDYDYVVVFTGCCRAVCADGTVSVFNC